MSVIVDERISDEIEALEAILMDDVTVHYNQDTSLPEGIETVVFPSTGEDADQQYVCVTLQVVLTPGYPDTAPKIYLRNPRGLDDTTINQIQQQVQQKVAECLGSPVVFELIEVIRENLTSSNLPSGQCVICLYGFRSGDLFTKTACYHHFHSHCLARHMVAAERNYKDEQDKLPPWQRQADGGFKAFCPVCREPITCNVAALSQATPPLELESDKQFEATAELRAMQARMASLYLHQQSKGGIIDIEADEKKMLFVTQVPESETVLEENGSEIQSDGASGPPHPEPQPMQTQPMNQNQSNGSHKNHSSHRGGGGNNHYKGHRNSGGSRGRGHMRRHPQFHRNTQGQPTGPSSGTNR